MRQFVTLLVCLVVTSSSLGQGHSGEATLGQEAKLETVDKIVELLSTHYVFPHKAEAAATLLRSELSNGALAEASSVSAFAEALTDSLQGSTKDKHLRVTPIPVAGSVPTREQALDYWHRGAAAQRGNSHGFQAVKLLPNKIGYLDLRGFASLKAAKPRADAAMTLLENTDAIIIDLRKNGGGDPAMVQYLCSFFFDERLLLNSLYWRAGDQTDEFWVLDTVGAKKQPDLPLYVLTSSSTFSGAEEFSYNMQSRERATIIGETTGGGAHPGAGFAINDHYRMFISTGRAINPVTNTNWEGRGVKPDVPITADNAMAAALELATQAARERQSDYRALYSDAMGEVWDQLENAAKLTERGDAKAAEKLVQKTIGAAKSKAVMNDDSLLMLGKEYLERLKRPEIAALIFKASTKAMDASVPAHDFYGQALMDMNSYAEAKLQFTKAIDLAEGSGMPAQVVGRLRKSLEAAIAASTTSN